MFLVVWAGPGPAKAGALCLEAMCRSAARKKVCAPC